MFYATTAKLLNLPLLDKYKSIFRWKRLTPHLIIKDKVTNEIRELGVNDNCEILTKVEGQNQWKYINLKDVLFMSITNDNYQVGSFRYLNRIPQEMTVYSDIYYDSYTQLYSNRVLAPHRFPNIVLVHDVANNKKFLTASKAIDYKNAKLVPILNRVEMYDIIYDKPNSRVGNLLMSLCIEYGIFPEGSSIDSFAVYTNKDNEICFYIFIGNKSTYILLDVDFPDAFVDRPPNGYEMLNNAVFTCSINDDTLLPALKEARIEGRFKGSSLPIYDASAFRNNFPPFPEGTSLTYGFKPYQWYYLNKSIYNYGLIIAKWLNVTDYDRLPYGEIANFRLFHDYNIDENLTLEDNDSTFIITGKERAIKPPYTDRKQQYCGQIWSIQPDIVDGDLNLNVFTYNTYSGVLRNISESSHKWYKDAKIYRTPKNATFDYINEEPNVSHSDGEADNTPRPSDILILQKGFEGKTLGKNITELIASYQKTTESRQTIEHLKSYGFKDVQFLNLMGNNTGYFNKDNEFLTFIKDYNSNIEEQLVPKDMLIDSKFDYFNGILNNALVYIVDIKMLKALGCSDRFYHSLMPMKCIWFEVEDLYLYNEDGTLKDLNPKYIDKTTNEFVYDYKQFTKFKVKYLQRVKECVYDTQIENSSDFNYISGSNNKIIARKCMTLSEALLTLFPQYSQAVLCLDSISLDTSISKE